jgi:hypothetical protein
VETSGDEEYLMGIDFPPGTQFKVEEEAGDTVIKGYYWFGGALHSFYFGAWSDLDKFGEFARMCMGYYNLKKTAIPKPVERAFGGEEP